MYKNIVAETNGDVQTLALNRPKKLNALSLETITELIDAAEHLRDNDEVQFVILKAAGRVFSAGIDLSELNVLLDSENPKSSFRKVQYLGQKLVRTLDQIEQVVITQLDASAYGAGLAVALAGDFVVMDEEAVANLPESKIGMFLTFGLTPRIVSLIGPVRAKELIMLARDIPAQKCLDWGLIHDIAPAGEAGTVVGHLLEELRGINANARRIIKKGIRVSVEIADGSVALEDELVDQIFQHGDVRELVGKFTKR